MQQVKTRAGETLAQVWEAHRESVRRLLLGPARDLDLAGDLLQDTGLRAQAGVPSHRGGDARAQACAGTNRPCTLV